MRQNGKEGKDEEGKEEKREGEAGWWVGKFRFPSYGREGKGRKTLCCVSFLLTPLDKVHPS